MKILHIILGKTVKKDLVNLIGVTDQIAQETENIVITDKHIDIPNAEVIQIHYNDMNPFAIRNLFLKHLYTIMPDIIHVHGSWSYSEYQCLKMASNRGFVTFYSPYYEFTMKSIKKNFWKEKLWKLLWYQRPLLKKADFVIVYRQKEVNLFNTLGRSQNVILLPENSSEELIKLYTQAHEEKISSEVSIQTLAALYQQLHELLHSRPMPFVKLSKREQEQYDLFCETQGLNSTVKTIYEVPRYSDDDACGVIYKAIKKLKNDVAKKKADFNDIFQLVATIQNNDYDEDKLVASLKREGMYNFTCRIIQIADELCGVDEGFMPCLPLNDMKTLSIKLQLVNRNVTDQ